MFSSVHLVRRAKLAFCAAALRCERAKVRPLVPCHASTLLSICSSVLAQHNVQHTSGQSVPLHSDAERPQVSSCSIRPRSLQKSVHVLVQALHEVRQRSSANSRGGTTCLAPSSFPRGAGVGPVGKIGESPVAERMTRVSGSSRYRPKGSGLVGHPCLTPLVQAIVPSCVSTHAS